MTFGISCLVSPSHILASQLCVCESTKWSMLQLQPTGVKVRRARSRDRVYERPHCVGTNSNGQWKAALLHWDACLTSTTECQRKQVRLLLLWAPPESIDASRSTDSRCLWPLDIRQYTVFVLRAWTWHSIAPKMRAGRHQYLCRWGIKKWRGLHPSTYDCAFIFDTTTELALY